MIGDLLTQPILLIAGSEAGTCWLTEQANDPKEKLIVDGGNHFDMYDKEPYVTQAVNKIEPFLQQYL